MGDDRTERFTGEDGTEYVVYFDDDQGKYNFAEVTGDDGKRRFDWGRPISAEGFDSFEEAREAAEDYGDIDTSR